MILLEFLRFTSIKFKSETVLNLKNDLFAYAKFKRSSDGIKLTEQNFKITLNDFSQLDMGDSIVIGSGLHKVQLSKFNKFPNFSLDNEFSIDSSSLAKININMNLSQASIADLRDEINLHTDKTGIEATYDETTKKITLSEKFAGTITVSNLDIEGVDGATREPEFYFQMESIEDVPQIVNLKE